MIIDLTQGMLRLHRPHESGVLIRTLQTPDAGEVKNVDDQALHWIEDQTLPRVPDLNYILTPLPAFDHIYEIRHHHGTQENPRALIERRATCMVAGRWVEVWANYGGLVALEVTWGPAPGVQVLKQVETPWYETEDPL